VLKFDRPTRFGAANAHSHRLIAMRTLFVCRGNLCRSRVAEDIFRLLTWRVGGRSNYEVRSAGTKADPEGHQITTHDVEWADVICVMEKEQEALIRKRWPEHASKIRVLGIPDIYQRHDETLQALLTDVVRTLLADESRGRTTIDSTPPIERQPRSGGSGWRNGVLTSRSAGAIAALVAVAAIAGYLISSRVEPEQPVSSARTSSGPGRSVAPDVTVDAGTPAGRDIPSDQTGLVVPVPNRPFPPTPSAAPAESPMAARESPNPSSAEVLARILPDRFPDGRYSVAGVAKRFGVRPARVDQARAGDGRAQRLPGAPLSVVAGDPRDHRREA
jgi:protein-tyrosine-phosphatase